VLAEAELREDLAGRPAAEAVPAADEVDHGPLIFRRLVMARSRRRPVRRCHRDGSAAVSGCWWIVAASINLASLLWVSRAKEEAAVVAASTAPRTLYCATHALLPAGYVARPAGGGSPVGTAHG
jgi:hypothetical protein